MSYFLNYIYNSFNHLNYYAVIVFIFMSVVSLTVAVFFLVLRRDILGKRVSRLMGGGDRAALPPAKPKLIQEDSSGLIAKVANPLHALAAPGNEELQQRSRQKLVRAGFRTKQAYHYYWAAKVFLALVVPLVYLVRSFFLAIDLHVLLLCVLLGAVGFLIPNIVLLQLVQKRQMRIQRALPDALDMMVVCVEAGLGLDMTFKKVGEEVRSLSRDLSEELYLTNLEVRAGKPRAESLKNLAARTGVAGVQNLVTLLVQTNRFGTSIAKALRVHADALRTKRRQLAEEKAAKSAVALLFPLIFFILPSFFVVVIGPAVIRIARNLLPMLGGH